MQGFVLDTSEGQLFRAPGALFGEAHETNVHSGFLVGIWGSADSSGVHSQALCMLDDIDEVYIDMEYLSLRQSGISDVSVDNVTLDNRQSERDGEIVFKNEESVTNSATTPKAWAESLGVSASVSGKVFGIGTEGSTEYTPTEETMESTSYFRTRKTGMDTKVGVPGGKRYKVFFFFFYYKGMFSIEFKPKYSFNLRPGFTVNWPRDNGQSIAGIASTNIYITIHDTTHVPDGEVPGPVTPPERRNSQVTTKVKRSRTKETLVLLRGRGKWRSCLLPSTVIPAGV